MRTITIRKIQRKFILISGAAMALTLVSAASYAGFQWVPPSTDVNPSALPAAPTQPVASQPIANAPQSNILMPMPGEPAPASASSQQDLETQASTQTGAPQTPAPEQHILMIPGKALPQQTPPQGAQQNAQAPAPQQSAPQEANAASSAAPAPAPESETVAPQSAQNQPQPLLKTLSMAPAEQTPPPAPAQESAKTATFVPSPVEQEPMAQPAASPQNEKSAQESIEWNKGESAPASSAQAAAQPRVVMPKDAPQSAVNAEATTKALVINPFPNNAPMAAPAPMPAPEAQQPEPETANAAPSGDSFKKVSGFGSEVPLALALQQIAPAPYTFSYGENVNPGVRVSWEGQDKPWDQVISDTLSPLSLRADIEGTVVHISNTGQPSQEPEPQRRSEAEPAAQPPQATQQPMKISQADMRRKDIRDPGESPRAQPAGALAEVQPASGETEPEKAQDALPPSTSQEAAIPDSQEDSSVADIKPLLGASGQDEAAQQPDESAPAPNELWQARQGDSLKQTLGVWAQKANVSIIWNAAHDYTLESNVAVEESFEDAVKTAIAQGLKPQGDKPEMSFDPAPAHGKTGGTLIISDAKQG